MKSLCYIGGVDVVVVQVAVFAIAGFYLAQKVFQRVVRDLDGTNTK